MGKSVYFCTVILEKLTILNYKNIEEATLELSPKMNCFIGHNGVGKTNVLDAIYYLSFCHSAYNPIDSQVIRHGQEFFMLEGMYRSGIANPLQQMTISCSMKRGTKKHFKRNKKEYKRLSEHIGLIPIVMVSPSDTLLIEGGSEERRRLLDAVIAQTDRQYIDALNRYNKALTQRNTMLKQDEEPDMDVMTIWEEQMAETGETIYRYRAKLVERLIPVFQQFYEHIVGSQGLQIPSNQGSGIANPPQQMGQGSGITNPLQQERVSLSYTSHCQRGPLLDVIQHDRSKDRAVGYSLHGIHRDDLEILLDGYPMKREGSQGQQKSFVIALKLAQFELLRQSIQTTPLLLLDDIFDKLDAQRVEQIVNLVASDKFGQIFITDTNREHLDQILAASSHDYKIFEVDNGGCVRAAP